MLFILRIEFPLPGHVFLTKEIRHARNNFVYVK
jgi:hypothetical protein